MKVSFNLLIIHDNVKIMIKQNNIKIMKMTKAILIESLPE